MIQANTALQSGIDALDAQASTLDESGQLIITKCRALLRGYDRRYHAAGYVPLVVERLITAPLVNPDTNCRSRSFSLAGKIDLQAMMGGRSVLIDHKTTSQDIADPASPFWRQLVIEGQVSHYMLLLWLNGEKCDEAVWDVMKKPGISPKKLTKAEHRATVASREYFGWTLSDATLSALQIEDRETLEMYEGRLTHDCTIERPQHYFQRRTVPRLDSEILEYARELWEHSQDMLASRGRYKSREGKLPPRNSGACMLYGAPCKFLGICSGYDQSDSDKWTRKQYVHRELPELFGDSSDYITGDGRDILTNSRIRCWQTCRRKEHYEYTLGIERVDAEEKEALLFGVWWHIALNAWWSSFLTKEPDNGNRSADAAGSELARSTGSAGETIVPF